MLFGFQPFWVLLSILSIVDLSPVIQIRRLNMRWQSLPITTLAGGALLAHAASNSTTTATNATAPCGIVTSQVIDYYNDPSSMSLFPRSNYISYNEQLQSPENPSAF